MQQAACRRRPGIGPLGQAWQGHSSGRAGTAVAGAAGYKTGRAGLAQRRGLGAQGGARAVAKTHGPTRSWLCIVRQHAGGGWCRSASGAAPTCWWKAAKALSSWPPFSYAAARKDAQRCRGWGAGAQ